MNFANKSKVADNFSRGAGEYEHLAELQKSMADQLLQKITAAVEHPVAIVDLGCGTGYLASRLADKYPQATVLGIDLAPGMIAQAEAKHQRANLVFIVGDAESWSAPGLGIDMVVSNASLQWMDFQQVIGNISRQVKPGCNLFFNTFGPETLKELRLAGFRVNDFPDQEKLKDILSASWQIEEISQTVQVLEFASVKELICHLRAIGANSLSGYDPAKLPGIKQYLKANRQRPIKATFEIITGWFRVPRA